MKIQSILAVITATALAAPLRAETSVRQDVEAGVQQVDVDGDRFQFDEYSDTPNGFVLDHYNLDAEGDKTDIRFRGRDLGQDDQSAP